jgi:hypothetical protein
MKLNFLRTISCFKPVHQRYFCSVKAKTSLLQNLPWNCQRTALLLRWRVSKRSLCASVQTSKTTFWGSCMPQLVAAYRFVYLYGSYCHTSLGEGPGYFGVGPPVPDVLMDGILLHFAPNACRWTWPATAVLPFTNMQQLPALSHYYHHHHRRRPHCRPSQCAVFWRSRQ